MRARVTLTVLTVLVALFPMPVARAATTYYVNNGVACSDATGDSTVTPYCTIQAAADATSPGDTIDVAAGTYTSTDSQVVYVQRELTITGAGAGSTIIDGEDTRIGIAMSGGIIVSVSDLTVTNGYDASWGGGIRAAGTFNLTNVTVSSSAAGSGAGLGMANNTTATLTNVVFDQNAATSDGGGVWMAGSSGTNLLTIVNSSFTGNSAGGNGGAVHAIGTADPGSAAVDIDDSSFTGNDAATNGGALFLTGTELVVTIDDSTFTGNGDDSGSPYDPDNGGAIAASLSTVTISGSLISGNRASNGGGVYWGTGTVDLRNTTISGNGASSSGGGVYGATGTIENVTIAFNSAGAAGGLRGTGTTPTIRNTLIADNSATGTGPDCSEFISDGYNLIEDTADCTISGDNTGNVTGTDPQLQALADNGGPTQTHAFWLGAAPQNAGNPAVEGSGGSACLATDQRGETRSDFGACDIGAFELDTYVERLSGADRFSTAAAISTEFWPSGSDTVIIANGLNFPDALTGANLYGLDAPLLLVFSDSIPAATSSELSRLAPSTIYILGGTAVVDSGVETALTADWGSGTATVTRLAGADRYSTAVAITTEAFPSGVDTVLIANGLNFPDALAGGAAASKIGAALLITDPNTLPAVIEAEITRLAPDTIWIIGGTAAVSAGVETELDPLAGTSVERISGVDRFATAAGVATEFFDSADATLVATGFNYPDALAGALAGRGVSPVLLVSTSSIPAAVSDEIESMGSTTIFVLGGTVAVDGTAFSALEGIVGL